MKLFLANSGEVTYLGRVKEDVNYRDGKSGVRYSLSLKNSLGVGNVRCTEEAFQMAANIPEYVPVTIQGDLDDKWGFRVTAIIYKK